MNKSKYRFLTCLVFMEIFIGGILKESGIIPWTTIVQFVLVFLILLTLGVMFSFAVKERRLKPKTQIILSVVLGFAMLTLVCASIVDIFQIDL